MSCVSRVTWSMLDPLVESPPALWEQWVNDWFDTSVDESLEDFKEDTQQRYRAVSLWMPQWFF